VRTLGTKDKGVKEKVGAKAPPWKKSQSG